MVGQPAAGEQHVSRGRAAGVGDGERECDVAAPCAVSVSCGAAGLSRRGDVYRPRPQDHSRCDHAAGRNLGSGRAVAHGVRGDRAGLVPGPAGPDDHGDRRVDDVARWVSAAAPRVARITPRDTGMGHGVSALAWAGRGAGRAGRGWGCDLGCAVGGVPGTRPGSDGVWRCDADGDDRRGDWLATGNRGLRAGPDVRGRRGVRPMAFVRPAGIAVWPLSQPGHGPGAAVWSGRSAAV